MADRKLVECEQAKRMLEKEEDAIVSSQIEVIGRSTGKQIN